MTKAYDEAKDNKAEAIKADAILSKGRKFVDKDTGHEYPARIVYLSKRLTFQKTQLWYLQNLQGLTLEELSEYQQRYKNTISVIEQEVIEMLLKARSGDREAKAQLYDANKALFNASKSIFLEEIKAQNRQPEQNRLEDLLDRIGDAVLSEGKS